jgi:transmembrane sensor
VAGWLVIHPPLGLWPSLAELTADHHTGIGQRQQFALANGVAVELNGRTAVSLVDQGRGLALVDGEAFIQVSDAASRILVHAGGASLSVGAGSMNVRTSPRETCATCLAGRVLAHGPGGEATLSAGQALRIRPDGAAVVAQVDPTIADAWRRGLLIFQNTPLAEAVEAINRYRDGKIILASAALGRQPVDGVYHTDALNGIVAHLQGLLHVQVTQLPGNIAILA